MALASLIQDDFSASMWRGRKAPANAVYDAVNAIVLDDGTLARRGGDALWSGSDAGSTLTRLAAMFYPGPGASRVTAFGGTSFFTFSGTTPVTSKTTSQPGRPAGVAGVAAFAGAGGEVLLFGGSLKTAAYSTGTVTVTNNSTTVAGVGTSWTASVDGGMILRTISGRSGVVKTVDSNTQITLVSPWLGATSAGSTYSLDVVTDSSLITIPFNPPTYGTTLFVAAGGSGSPRLIVTTGNRAYISDRGEPLRFDAAHYHELPAGAAITGAEGVGDSAMLFTNAGVFAIDNLSLDLIDAFGNQQSQVRRVNGDVVLWGDLGIANWAGGVIVPGTDDVVVLGLDGSTVSLTGDSQNEKIRRLYRSYVALGYRPGIAAVYNQHYVLPVMNGSSVADVLVCRLDRGAAWTRFSGHAAGNSYAVLPPTTSAGAKLLSTNAQRVTDVSGAFAPAAANALDADSTTSDCVIITRDYPLGGNQPGFAQRIRARFELTDDGSGATAAPTVTPAFSSDQDAGTFTTLTERGEQGGAAGWGVSDGSKFNWALVGRRRERIRFRLTVTGACASFVLRSLELLTRPSGKQ